MIDTHSHLLPGLDDGSSSVDSSLRMAVAAATAGVTMVVCTPHLRDFDEDFLTAAQEVLTDFRAKLTEEGVDLRLTLGYEIDASLAAVASGEQLNRLTFEGSAGVLLVEVPHWGWPVHLLDTIFRLRTNGFIPLLAHPERNDHIQADPGLLEDCIRAGAVIQATAASLGDGFGRAGRTAFFRALSEGHVGILASDAHFHRRDSWTVSGVVEGLRRSVPAEMIDNLVRVNPERVLRGEAPLSVVGDRPSLWRRLFGGR